MQDKKSLEALDKIRNGHYKPNDSTIKEIASSLFKKTLMFVNKLIKQYGIQMNAKELNLRSS
jgi:hypothetical protein